MRERAALGAPATHLNRIKQRENEAREFCFPFTSPLSADEGEGEETAFYAFRRFSFMHAEPLRR